MMEIEAIAESFAKSAKIALIAHIMPDGDTLGSCLALRNALRRIGKTADIFCQDSFPPVYGFLPDIEHIVKEQHDQGAYDLAVAVDCSDPGRMGACISVFDSSKMTANIDHHISNTGFAALNFVNTKAAATGEIVFRLIKILAGDLHKNEAVALFTAISTDSGNFSFSSTTPDTYRIAAELLETGINVDEITTLLYKSFSFQRVKLLGRVLNTLTLHEGGKVTVLKVFRKDIADTGSSDADTENMVNYAKDIYGVELGILLKEMPDGTTKASFRSKAVIDVSRLAAVFGGGGHKRAAGAEMNTGVDESEMKILDTVHKLLEELC